MKFGFEKKHMGYKNMFVVLFLMLCLVACGTVDTVHDPVYNVSSDSSTGAALADRCEIKGSSGTYLVCVGTSERKFRDEAIKSAKINTLTEIAEFFGVLVDHAFEESEREINGVIEYQIKTKSHVTGKPIWLKNYRIEESLVNKQKNGYTSSVTISIPKSEYDRIRKELDEEEKYSKIKAKALTAWILESDFREECVDKIKDFFQFLKEKRGLNIVEQEETSARSAEEIARLHPDYAFFLKIKYDKVGEESYSSSGETIYYPRNLKVELYNLLKKGAIEADWSADQIKCIKIHGIYAVDGDCVSQAIEKIKNQIDK